MQTNIVLIGMPGAGKSSVGVLLAKVLGMSFVDTDLLIQEKTGLLLQEIIDQQGVEQFLEIEKAVLLQLEQENCVIATGGSAVYSKAAMIHLKKSGRLLYLKLSYEEIAQRINNMSSRGIAMGKGQTLIDLYQERVVLYEKYADIIVDCSGMPIEDLVGKISNLVKVGKKI